MEEIERRLLHLYESNILPRKVISKLIRTDSILNELHHFTKKDLTSQLNLTPDYGEKLFSWLNKKPFENLEFHVKEDVTTLTILSKEYPSLLKLIPDPPLVLYIKGNPTLLTKTPALSVVGTRKPSQEAKDKMLKILSPLIKKDWLIVSGMARGIDSYAHWLACHCGGKTIAVLGGGFSHIYPPENKVLFSKLAKEQLLLTEYPPDIPPRRYHFPERNRIISGLSFATLVVEAEVKSGSLITADQALEQGRDVFAVPGSPLAPQSQGVNKLIQQGAKLINSYEDILEETQILGL